MYVYSDSDKSSILDEYWDNIISSSICVPVLIEDTFKLLLFVIFYSFTCRTSPADSEKSGHVHVVVNKQYTAMSSASFEYKVGIPI